MFHSRTLILNACRRLSTPNAVIAVVSILSIQTLGLAELKAETTGRPNIIFIMADDMGYGDAGCYNTNSKIPTPNIDRLATEGMRFTDAHAPAAVCVPTRYGLMTGRYPFRMKRAGGSLIEPGRLTIASQLKSKGYRTGMVGKWHLGFDGVAATQRNETTRGKKRRGRANNLDFTKPLRGGPVDHGFDEYFGIPASLDIPPYFYIRNDLAVQPPSNRIEASNSNSAGWSPIQGAFWRAGGVAPDFKHVEVTPRLTSEAIAFLKRTQAETSDRPFFLYLAFPSPHTPWMPTKEFDGTSKAGMYGDFMHQVDTSVGRVLKALDELSVADNTLVIFTSDNGPVWYPHDAERFDHASVGPLRGMKGDAWDGGHRMPFVARWPGQIPRATISDEVICHTDMLATFTAIVGEQLPDNTGEDSFNILPVLLGKKRSGPVREAIVHQSSGSKVLSIRQGDWKLIPTLGSAGFSKPRKIDPETGGPIGQLYNMNADRDEQNNVYSQHPDVVKRMTDLLERYKSAGRSR
jgi:arylsulfatase A